MQLYRPLEKRKKDPNSAFQIVERSWMSRFCLPAYMRVIEACKRPGAKRRDVDTELFDTISPGLSLVDASQASSIRSGGKKLPMAPHDAAMRADAIQVASRMREFIDKCVDPDKLAEAVGTARFLLLDDSLISEDERIGELTGFTKANYRSCSSYEAATLLAELFLYCCRQPRADVAQADLPVVDNEYMKRALASAPTTLTTSSGSLKATLNCAGFEDTFGKVGGVSLKGGRRLEVYLLNELGSEGFDYSKLIDFLETNLGEYCLGREKIKALKDSGRATRTALEGLKRLTGAPTGNDIADMLAYVFLEEALGAPKVMSAIELSRGLNCSGVHLLCLPSGRYQYVYGAASIEGTFVQAVEAALAKASSLVHTGKVSKRCANPRIFAYEDLDLETASALQSMLLPKKGAKVRPEPSFGVFLGYGLSPENPSVDVEDWHEGVRSNILSELQANEGDIAEAIDSLGLSDFSFYFFVLPIGDASHQGVIFDMLTGGVS